MKGLLEVDKRALKKALSDLRDNYSAMNGAVYLTEVEEDHWKFSVRSAYTELVSKIVSDVELPLSVLGTLAVIAYKNPVLQSDVVKVRGTNTYDHIHDLERLKFIRRDKEGNSYRVYLTDKFFDYFEIEGGNIREIFNRMQERRQELLAEKKAKMKVVEIKDEKLEEVEPTARSGEEIMADVDKKLAELGSKMDELDEEKEKHVSEMSEMSPDDEVLPDRNAKE
jgi:segregation and condensation protein B